MSKRHAKLKEEKENERKETGRVHAESRLATKGSPEVKGKEKSSGRKEERKRSGRPDGRGNSKPRKEHARSEVLGKKSNKPSLGFQGKCVLNSTGEPHGTASSR